MFPGLMLTLVTVAAGVVPRPVETALRDNSGVDWEQVRARTREVEAAEARHRALQWPGAEEAAGGRVRLQSARGSHEDISEELERWVRPGALSEELLKDQQGAAVELEALGVALAASRTRVEEHLKAVEEGLAGSPHQEELRERVRRQRQWVEERSKEVEDLAAQAAAALRAPEASFFEKLRRFSFQTRREEAAGLLERLRTRLQEWVGRSNGVVGAELTYVQGGVSAAALPTGEVKPAYLSGGGVLPTLEDTSREREVELSPEVQAQAKHLGSAKAAYEFVKNQTRLEWYHGAMKGSRQTLRDLRGNDADLSTLLVALLRAQGTPARYVRGTVELGLEQLAGAMGLLSSQEADQLDAALAGGPAFTLPAAASEKVLAILTASGVPYEVLKQGGQVVGARMERIWVEAYVSYADYRGVGEGQGARQWVPLEPALTARAKAAVRAPVVDVLGAWSETPASLTQAYLEGSAEQSPLGFFKQRVEQYLAANKPGLKYEQVLRTVEVRPERLAQLPGSLPYKVVAVQQEVPFLPESVQQRVRLTARDESGELLKVELPLHRLTGHRTVLGYKSAEAVDEEAVSLAGGLYEAPASLVNVRPVMRVDGREVAVGTRGVRLGSEHTWTLEVLLPGGTVRRMDNRILAGNFVALGVGSPGNGYQSTDEAGSVEDLDGKGVRFLYERAAQYVNAWTAGEEELARLVQVVAVRPTANFAFVQNQLQVHSTLGVPQRLEWRGLEVDADFRAMTPVELVAGRGKALARLSGYEGSYQEARTLAVGTREEAVSSTSVLQAARAQNIEILALTPQNQAQELTKLEASAEVLRDVTDLLALGRHVLIPAKPVTVRDWSGTGFIANDPATEEGGYFLSGRISGAETVVHVSKWTEEDLVDALEDPSPPILETDTSRVAGLVKIKLGDFQRVMAGTMAPLQLRVVAVTAEGRRVKGAQVTFSRRGNAKPGIADKKEVLEELLEGTGEDVLQRIHGLPDTVTVSTGEDGEAKVFLVPDPGITRQAIVSTGKPELQLLGVTEVMASVPVAGDTLQLSEPFRVIVRPEVPDTLVPRRVMLEPTWAGLELGYPLGVRVLDKFGNMLANQPVTWTSSDSRGKYIDPSQEGARSDLRVRWLNPDELSQVSALGSSTPMDGEVRAEFIPGSPGLHSLTAQVGEVRHQWKLLALDPGESRYAFRVVTERGALFHGIYDTPLNSPIAGMVLRWAEGRWGVVKGHEPGLADVKVRMVVTDEEGKELLNEAHAPFEQQGVPGDDDIRVIFRPRYLMENGVQDMTFTAEVKEAEQTSPVCCAADVFYVKPVSAVPRLTVAQVKEDLEEVELAGAPALLADTKALKLMIRHPSDRPVYFRISQTDKDGNPVKIVDESILAGLDRHPSIPKLFKVPANTHVSRGADGRWDFDGFSLSFPVIGTVGGKVAFELFAPDHTQSDLPVPSDPSAAKQVSLTMVPRIHFVGVDEKRMNLDEDDSTYIAAVHPDENALASATAFYATLSPLPEVGDRAPRSFMLVATDESGVVYDEREIVLSYPSYRSPPIKLLGVDQMPGAANPSLTSAALAGHALAPSAPPDITIPLVPGAGVIPRINKRAPPSEGPLSTDATIRTLEYRHIKTKGWSSDPPGQIFNPAMLCVGEGASQFEVENVFLGGFPLLPINHRLRWMAESDAVEIVGARVLGNNKMLARGREIEVKARRAVDPPIVFSVFFEEDQSKASTLTMRIRVREFEDVYIKPFIFAQDDGSEPASSKAEIDAELDIANRLWKQACLRFVKVQEPRLIRNTQGLRANSTLRPTAWGNDWPVGRPLAVLGADTEGIRGYDEQTGNPPYIEVYYRERFLNEPKTLGQRKIGGVTVTTKPNKNATLGDDAARACSRAERGRILAHELGHAMGLGRVYELGDAIPFYPPYINAHSMEKQSLMYESAVLLPELEGKGVDISLEEALNAIWRASQ